MLPRSYDHAGSYSVTNGSSTAANKAHYPTMAFAHPPTTTITNSPSTAFDHHSITPSIAITPPIAIIHHPTVTTAIFNLPTTATTAIDHGPTTAIADGSDGRVNLDSGPSLHQSIHQPFDSGAWLLHHTYVVA